MNEQNNVSDCPVPHQLPGCYWNLSPREQLIQAKIKWQWKSRTKQTAAHAYNRHLEEIVPIHRCRCGSLVFEGQKCKCSDEKDAYDRAMGVVEKVVTEIRFVTLKCPACGIAHEGCVLIPGDDEQQEFCCCDEVCEAIYERMQDVEDYDRAMKGVLGLARHTNQ